MLKLARRLFAAVFLSVMAAALLSLIPALEEQGENGRDVAAFRPGGPVTLTEANLPDVLSKRPPGLVLRRADWRAGRLSLSVTARGRRESLDRDLLGMVRILLVETANVDVLRLEVEAGSDPFTLEAARSDLVRDPGMDGAESMPASRYLSRMFRVTGPRGDGR